MTAWGALAQAMGRIMSDPLNITVNYTVALGPTPDVTSSAINCQSSFILLQNYERDRVLQDELQELYDQRRSYSMYTDLIDLWEHALDMREHRVRLRACACMRTHRTHLSLIHISEPTRPY